MFKKNTLSLWVDTNIQRFPINLKYVVRTLKSIFVIDLSTVKFCTGLHRNHACLLWNRDNYPRIISIGNHASEIKSSPWLKMKNFNLHEGIQSSKTVLFVVLKECRYNSLIYIVAGILICSFARFFFLQWNPPCDFSYKYNFSPPRTVSALIDQITRMWPKLIDLPACSEHKTPMDFRSYSRAAILP